MPSMQNSHKISEHLQYLPQAEYSGQFLPSIPRQEHSHLHPRSGQRDHTRKLISSSVPSSAHLTMVHSDDVDKKFDRKSIARRQLVETLSSPHGQGQGGRGIRRTQSFNHASHSFAPHNPGNKTLQNLATRDTRPEMRRNGRPEWIRQKSTSQNITADKAREAIETWNHLVLELHSEQYRQQLQSQAHLAVVSDNISESSLALANGDAKTANLNSSLSRVKRENTTVSVSTGKFPAGLGFTRYRPITPNLLVKLDKQKLPPRKRTQLWINQLPEQRRSHTSSSDVQSPVEEKIQSPRSRTGESPADIRGCCKT